MSGHMSSVAPDEGKLTFCKTPAIPVKNGLLTRSACKLDMEVNRESHCCWADGLLP